MNILFIFGTGSEVRQFLHSGIISQLVKAGNKIFISAKLSIADEARKADVSIIELPWYDMSYPAGILSHISKALDLSFERKYQYKAWTYNNKSKEKKQLDLLIGIFASFKPVRYVFSVLERRLQKSSKVLSQPLIKLLAELNIQKVIVNAARNYPAVLFAAQSLNIPAIILYHTNKDIYAQGRLSFRFTRYGVWNKEMAQELMFYNPFIKPDAVEIIGCSHFSYLLNNKFEASRDILLKEYNLDHNGDFLVLYTAAGPGVIPNEPEYINDIYESLEDTGIKNFKIIIRTNPMDFTNLWDPMQSDKIIVIRPKWFYDPIVFFNYTKYEDLKDYVSLLRSCNVCINIPSTVTVECAIFKIPVINICYNNKLNAGSDILKFWNAPFYKNAVKYKAALPAFTIQELKGNLQLIKTGNHGSDNQQLYLQSEIGIDINNLTKAGFSFILK